MEAILHQARIISDVGMVVLIWLVQLIIYPAFYEISTERFISWHEGYTKKITLIVLPLMICQAASAGLQFTYTHRIERMAELICIVVAWLVTFGLSVPCHQKLHAKGKDSEIIAKLIATNWIRTISWSVAALVYVVTG